MANSRGSSNVRNLIYSGKHALLPPKSPFPSVSPSYVDYVHSPAIGSKAIQKPREGNTHHQRTSSESYLVEEQPSWLDDLLNEPDTPVRRGHRRSSSDSFAYVDANNVSNMDYAVQDDYRYNNMISGPAWGSSDCDHQKDLRHASFNAEMNLAKQKSRVWESPLNVVNNPSGLSSAKDNIVRQSSGSFCTQMEADGIPSTASEKQDVLESGLHDPKTSSEKKDSSNVKPSASETDTKRAKQYVFDLVVFLFKSIS